MGILRREIFNNIYTTNMRHTLQSLFKIVMELIIIKNIII